MRHGTNTIGPDRLLSVPGMEAVPKQTRAKLDGLSTELRLPAGQRLMKQGNPGRESFLIVDGAVAVRSHDEIIAVRGRGSLVGEAAVIMHCPRNADVVALTDLVVLVISPAELSSLCEDIGFRVWLDGQLGAHAASA
jgi:CRP-like cAMP-binding protein